MHGFDQGNGIFSKLRLSIISYFGFAVSYALPRQHVKPNGN
jgi:hypothetical protein